MTGSLSLNAIYWRLSLILSIAVPKSTWTLLMVLLVLFNFISWFYWYPLTLLGGGNSSVRRALNSMSIYLLALSNCSVTYSSNV